METDQHSPKIAHLEEKRLEKLPAVLVAEKILALPAKKRLDVLLGRNDAHQIIHHLAPQDYYCFAKQLGDDFVAPLIELANIEQLNHILDIEGWQGENLAPGKYLQWCFQYFQASERKFFEWLYTVDFELLVLLFKHWLDIVVIPDGAEREEYTEILRQTTIDDQYYFSVRYPQYKDFIVFILSFLFENHPEFYKELMIHTLYSTETEISELSYQFHRGRLTDNAVPDIWEAKSIYRPTSFSTINVNEKQIRPSERENINPPHFALILGEGEKPLFESAFNQLNKAEKDHLEWEAAAIANKVVIADQFDAAEIDDLEFAVRKSAALINLGLDIFSTSHHEKAVYALKNINLETLFRLGHSRVVNIKKRAETLLEHGWVGKWPHGINILDPEWHQQFELLLGNNPMIYRDASDDIKVQFNEDFIRTNSDCLVLEKDLFLLEETGSCAHELLSLYSTAKNSHPMKFHDHAQLNREEDLTLGALFISCGINAICSNSWSPKPVAAHQWPQVAAQISENALAGVLNGFLNQQGGESAYFKPIIRRFFDEFFAAKKDGEIPSFKLQSLVLFS